MAITQPKVLAEKAKNRARKIPRKYTIKRGDSWFKIAGDLYRDFYGDDEVQAQRMAELLARANADIDTLQPGMIIRLPAPRRDPYVSKAFMDAASGTGVASTATPKATTPAPTRTTTPTAANPGRLGKKSSSPGYIPSQAENPFNQAQQAAAALKAGKFGKKKKNKALKASGELAPPAWGFPKSRKKGKGFKKPSFDTAQELAEAAKARQPGIGAGYGAKPRAYAGRGGQKRSSPGTGAAAQQRAGQVSPPRGKRPDWKVYQQGQLNANRQRRRQGGYPYPDWVDTFEEKLYYAEPNRQSAKLVVDRMLQEGILPAAFTIWDAIELARRMDMPYYDLNVVDSLLAQFGYEAPDRNGLYWRNDPIDARPLSSYSGWGGYGRGGGGGRGSRYVDGGGGGYGYPFGGESIQYANEFSPVSWRI